MTLRQRATLVEVLSSSLEHGGVALGTVPKALSRILAEEAWREFVTSRGEHVTHDRFADFVTTPPLKGLGASVDLIERVIADDDETVRLLRETLKGTRNNITGKRGTRRDYSLERIKRDAPELHAEVLAGRLSAHGAMVRAGFQPKTVSVPVTRPEAVARALLKYMSAADIAKLIAVLVGAADLSAYRGDRKTRVPWFKVDDTFDTHPKVIAAGNEAVGLFIRCGAYAARHLTDGFVPKDVALLYGSAALADALVQAKLWHRARGGWLIHDYLVYNPTREAVDNDRKMKAERQRRWREARRRRVANASQDASSDASQDGAPTRPAPKEAGREGHPTRGAANGRASPPGSPARSATPKPAWCGQCDERTRQTPEPSRCPRCHPLATGIEAEAWRVTHPAQSA